MLGKKKKFVVEENLTIRSQGTTKTKTQPKDLQQTRTNKRKSRKES